MQRVLVEDLKLLRNGDISIMEEAKYAEDFWLERSGLHSSHVIYNYRLEFSRLEREVHPLLGDQLLFMGRVADLKMNGISAIENWFWRGFEDFTHFLTLERCNTSISDLIIAKLLGSKNQTLSDYILRDDHDPLFAEELLPADDELTLLEGRLITGNSFNLVNAALSSFNISDALIHPGLPNCDYNLESFNFYNAQA